MLNSRPLIDTPGRRRGAGYDFTPIGHARRSGAAASAAAASPTHRIPDPTQFSDVSFDLTHHDDILEGVEAPLRLFSTQQQQSGGPLPGRFLKDGSGLVMDLQRRLQQLETENYNLKITVERLRRYLDATPEEQLLLLDQNIELRQKVMQMARDAPARRASAVSVGISAASSPGQARGENVAAVAHLEAELAVARSEIEGLESQVAAARAREPSTEVVAELEARAARLEADAQEERLANQQLRLANEQLQRAADHARADEQLQSSEYSRARGETQALQAEVDRLQQAVNDRQDASASAIAAEREAARVRGQLAEAERETARVRGQLAEAEQEVVRIRDDLGAAHAELGRLRTLTPAADVHAIQTNLDTSLQRERKLQERVAELQREVSDIRLAAASTSAADRQRATELEETQARLRAEETSRRSAEQDLETLRSQQDRSLEQQSAQHEEALEQLRQERQRLRDQVQDLQQQLLTASGSDEVAAQLLQQVQELTEKAYFYEDEYDLLEQAMERLKRDLARDREAAARQLDSADKRAREANTTANRLRLARDAAVREADAVQQAHARLLQEYEELQMQHARAVREVEQARTQQPLWQQKQRELELTAQVERLLAEVERMRSDVGVMVSEHQKVVAQLEQRLRDAQSAARTAALQDDLERLELVRARAAAESKVRQLQTDLDQAHQEFARKLLEYEEQVKAVKAATQKEAAPVREGYAEQLERELERSAAVHREEVERLERQVRETTADVQAARRALEQERAARQTAAPSAERSTLLEWEGRYAEAKRELRRLESQYDAMKEELLSKCRQLKDSKALIADDLEVAQRRLARVKLEPKEEPMPAVDLLPWQDRLRLCQLQLHYYKAVLYDANLRANDLAFANSFVVASIVGLSRIVGDAGSKLRAAGVYPEPPRKVLFRGVALMVVAMVRLKNRGKRHAKRSQQLGELRREIVKAKTMLE